MVVVVEDMVEVITGKRRKAFGALGSMVGTDGNTQVWRSRERMGTAT